MINILATEGKTSLKSVFDRNYEYNSNRIQVHRLSKIGGRTTKNRIKSIDISELECIKFLSSYYPMEMDCVKAEFSQWTEKSNKIITPALVAAKVLWLCRINKIPLMLKEISRGFRIRTKIIMHMQSETDYIPPLGTQDFIGRLSLQLNLPEEIKDRALYLDKRYGSLNGTTPTVRACCAIIKATETERFAVPIGKVASALGITTMGIRMALEKLKE